MPVKSYLTAVELIRDMVKEETEKAEKWKDRSREAGYYDPDAAEDYRRRYYRQDDRAAVLQEALDKLLE